MDIKGVLEFFATTDIGRILLLIVAAFVAGGVLIWRDNNRLRTMRLKLSAEQSERDDKLEQKRLDNEQRENDRRAVGDAEMRHTLGKLAETQSSIVTILQRMESKQHSNDDLARNTKTAIDNIKGQTQTIHQDLRKGVVTVISKLDQANSDSATRAENTQQVINNRSQETQKTVHAVGGNIQTALNSQNTVLDQMLTKLGELNKEVSGLRGDFRDNVTAQAAATAHREDERFASIQNTLREIAAGIVQLKRGTQPLDPAKAPIDPLTIPTLPADIRTTQTLAPVPSPTTVEMPKLTESPDAT